MDIGNELMPDVGPVRTPGGNNRTGKNQYGDKSKSVLALAFLLDVGINRYLT